MILRQLTKNAKTYNITVKDDDGVVVTDLATATDIIFVMKTKKTDADLDSKLIKVLTDPELTINDPETGDIKIVCTSDDLDILGSVFVACQINYPLDRNIEVKLSDKNTDEEVKQIEFVQDVIRG